MLNKTWAPGLYHTQQLRYEPVVGFKYWPILGYFNKQNINQFTNKTTCRADFDEVNQVVLDETSTNMESLVQTGKDANTNDTYPTTIGYYVEKYVSDTFTIQEYITRDGKVSKSGVL